MQTMIIPFVITYFLEFYTIKYEYITQTIHIRTIITVGSNIDFTIYTYFIIRTNLKVPILYYIFYIYK